jgi:hypothetical protein
LEAFAQAQNSLSSSKPLINEKESKQLFFIAKQCLDRSQYIMGEIGGQLIQPVKNEKIEEVPNDVNRIDQIQKRLRELESLNAQINQKISSASTKEKAQIRKELNKNLAVISYYEQFIQLRVQKEVTIEKE